MSSEHELPTFPGLSAVAPLDTGGMGSVFRAWQDELGRAVAVKTLRADLVASEELREQFAREARILAQLDDPSIVPVHFAGSTDDGPYYVMRLVEGTSVEHHLAGAEPAAVAAVFRDIAAALGTAHREGVLHRDVKPANVLVETSGRPVLVDFGLSVSSVAEHAEAIVGTPDFLAPEVLAGEGYSVASDVYALGATLYVVLAGRVPFPANDLVDKLRAIREDEPVPPRAIVPSVPKPLQAICLKAMERAPHDRYASASELQRDLERFLAGDPVAALPVRTRSLLRRKVERHLDDHAEWEELGILSEGQRLELRLAYERLDEEQRSPMLGAFRSVPNLLFLAGLVLTVFGPVLLLAVAWSDLAQGGRPLLPAVPALLLLAIGRKRWLAEDRRRGLACFVGAVLLVVPSAFALADLLPALRTIVDDAGNGVPIVPGRLWLPEDDAPPWMHAGSRLLHAKVLVTALLTLVAIGALLRRTRSAVFLWLTGFASAAAVASIAHLVHWRELPLAARWILEGTGALAVMACGLPLERAWHRDRALPFYALGFSWSLVVVMEFASEGLPARLLDPPEGLDANALSFVFHGALFASGGVALHHRGTALLRHAASLPLLVAFLMVHIGLTGLARHGSVAWEFAVVGENVGFLLLGLALRRNALVLPAAIALPFTVGSVSERHMDSLWAWSMTVVLSGISLLVLALRLSRRDARSERSAGT